MQLLPVISHSRSDLFPLGQVKHRLNRVMAAGPREIKFVDRTFNLDRKRTLAIWSHILARTGPPCHFEIEGRLLDDDMLRFLAQVPEGRFNFEVGVQSTDPAVLAAVNRSTDWGRPRTPWSGFAGRPTFT